MRWSLVEHDTDHFRNHVTGAPHDHGVADAHVLAPHLVLIVQGGIGDDHPCDLHGTQARDRRDCASAADLDIDRLDHGLLLARRKLVRDGPPRRARHKPELYLRSEIVDLVDDAIDVIGQGVTTRADALEVFAQPVTAKGAIGLGTHGQTISAEVRQHVGMVLPCRHGLAVTEGICEEGERTCRCHFRIELAHCSSSGIARIRECALTALSCALIELLERGARHVHLATNLEQVRPVRTQQAQRHRGDGTHAMRDILTSAAVAARRSAGQHAINIEQADCESVNLGLHRKRNVGTTELFRNALKEGARVLIAERVAQTQHRHFVPDLGETARDHGTDTLGRRIRHDKFRMRKLNRLQFAHQAVIGAVGDLGCIEHVIAVIVLRNFTPQVRGKHSRFGFDARFGLRHRYLDWRQQQAPATGVLPGSLDRVLFTRTIVGAQFVADVLDALPGHGIAFFVQHDAAKQFGEPLRRRQHHVPGVECRLCVRQHHEQGQAR